MVYKQKQRRRRRRAAPQSRGYLNTASQALAVAYAVKKLINVEYFRVATSFNVDPNTTGAVANMTNISQGDGTSNRQGNKIRAKQLLVQGKIRLHPSATDSHVRMVLVRDNNGSTTQPTIAQLYGSATNFFNNLLKVGDPQTNSRFSVLWDKLVLLNSDTPTKGVHYTMPLDHHIYYSGTAGSDEGKGNIYLMIASNEATNDPIVSILCQVVYIDN